MLRLNIFKNNIILLLIIIALFISILIPIASFVSPFLTFALLAIIIAVPFFLILLNDPSIGLLIITFLLPFEQIGGIQISGMNVRLSQIVFIATFSVWILAGLFQKEFYIKFDKKLFLLAIFLIVSIISFSSSINLFRSVQIFFFISFTFLVYIFVSSYKFSRDLIKKMMLILFLSMIVTSLFGLFQFVGDMIGIPPAITGLEENYVKAVFGFPRIQSTANEPLNFANYLVLPLSIAFAIYFSGVKAKAGTIDLKKLSLPVLILGSITMILTFSRGGWGALAFSFLILGAKYFRQILTKKNLLIALIVSIISVSGISAIVKITNAPFTLAALAGRINISDFSARDRVRTTNEGLEAWKHNKLTGIGLGAFGPLVAKYENIEPDSGWQTVNNEYAELLIETGIIGLGIMLIFWISVSIENFLRTRKIQGFDSAILSALFTALLGMLLQYVSFSTLYVFHLWFLLGLINNDYFRKKLSEAEH